MLTQLECSRLGVLLKYHEHENKQELRTTRSDRYHIGHSGSTCTMIGVLGGRGLLVPVREDARHRVEAPAPLICQAQNGRPYSTCITPSD
jgi:hypothetical protein